MKTEKTEKPKHNHAEAFALMWYRCESCGHTERFWNSRDGVTPFGCGCPSCGQTLSHSDWQRDVYAPDHKLRYGQRFWRDGTPDEAEAIMRRRIDRLKNTHLGCDPKDEKELIEYARSGEGEFQKGWPMLSVAGLDA